MSESKLQQRFWQTTKEVPGGCWAWLGRYGKKDGYGYFWMDGKYRLAHRVSLEWKLGRPIMDGYWSLHRCNNKFCVRPGHLYEGTPAQNILDQYRAGTGKTKLGPKERKQLLAAIKGGESIPKACKRFGVKRNWYSDHKRLLREGKRNE